MTKCLSNIKMKTENKKYNLIQNINKNYASITILK